MDKSFVKIAKVVQRKKNGKTFWCVVGHKKTSKGKLRNFGCYSSKEKANERLGQIYAFKHKKAELLTLMAEASDILEEKGMFHLADAVSVCNEAIATGEAKSQFIPLKLGKIINLLERKGEQDLAESLDSLLPDIIGNEDVDNEEAPKAKSRMPADKIYLMASMLKHRYLQGEIDETNFEYSKMQELESMLKMGFLLPPPASYSELPKDSKNWWDHFTKGSK